MANLALFGGSPEIPLAKQKKWTWPPRYPKLGNLVRDYVNDPTQPLSIQGRDGPIADVENELKRRFERRHAIFCSSGTMALYSAYFSLDIKPGDEIICPTVTYHATASPALHFGAHVVLVDVENDTGNILAGAVKNAITPRTKAIVTNAMWGHPVEQEEIKKICISNNIAWIEDCSHAQFSSYCGKPVGSWGDIACASLQGDKLVSGGEGGVLLTNSDSIHDTAVLLGHNLKRSETTITNDYFAPIGRTGYGLKLRGHPLSAILIHDQLINHVDHWIADRTSSLTRLSHALSPLEGLRPPVIRSTTTSMGAWYGYKPWVDFKKLGIKRTALVNAIAAEGVEISIPKSPPLHQLPLFGAHAFPIKGFSKHDNSKTEYPGSGAYLDGIINLPTFTGLRDEESLIGTIQVFQKIWSNLDKLRSL
jgi:dTDP-4-amino-4,6-dideoxygalactose transaminase